MVSVHSRLFYALLLVLLLAGCAGLLQRPEPPVVNLAGLEVNKLGLFEQRYTLHLRIQNPNDFPLPVTGMRYGVELNDREFARGVSPRAFTVPAFGEEVVEVSVTSHLGRVVEQLGRLGLGQTLDYRLTGDLNLKGYSFALPFEYEGEVTLPTELPGGW